MFTLSRHAAGCLPDSDFWPTEFDTAREAWRHVAWEVDQIEDDGDFLAAHTALHVQDFDQTGNIPVGEDTTYVYAVELSHG